MYGKKLTPRAVVTKGEISYRDRTLFFVPGYNVFISAVKLGILTWGFMGIVLFLEPASSGHLCNCSF